MSSPRRRRGEGQIDWVGIVQVVVILSICSGVWIGYKLKTQKQEDWKIVENWLQSYHLSQYSSVFQNARITTLDDVVITDFRSSYSFSHLTQDARSQIQDAANSYMESVVLEQWLKDNDLDKYIKRLSDNGIRSLEALAHASESQLMRVTSSDRTLRDYNIFETKIKNLKESIPNYAQVKKKHWEKFIETLNSHKWNIGGMVLFSLFIGGLAILVNMNYANYLTPSRCSKQSILEFVTGKYLNFHATKVTWDWDEPQVVGKMMTFRIKFYQRNGRPYPISDHDNLLVEILVGGTKIPPSVQISGPNPVDANTVKVAFTVHRSGDYTISVMIVARHIRGSPFTKPFQPGPVDPTKTGFVSQGSIVVCTKGVGHPLDLDLRDEYNNQSTYSPDNSNKNSYQIFVTESGSNQKIQPKMQIIYDKSSTRFSLSIKMETEGCYHALAYYNDFKLKNGDFHILVLSDSDAAMVKKNVDKKSHTLYYEARLLTCNLTKQQKARKVFCYISPKQLTVKEFYLKIFPKRLFTFRVCPSTKFQFLGINNQYEAPVMVIDDGCQAPVELASIDRNIIAATFTSFLLKNIGGSETFKDKQDFFYHEIRQLHSKRLHDRLPLRIQRQTLLESSFKATKNFSTSDWCRNFEIQFVGEAGLDWGGVRREWFEVVCTELFDPGCSGLFGRFKDDNQALVHPNSKRNPQFKLKYYEFAGKIVGKCLFESSLGGNYRQLAKARFTRSFLAQLIGLRVNYRYFEQDDPELYMSKVKYIEGNSVEDMDLVFAEDEYKDGQLSTVIDLIPNGSKVPVNDNNKLRYLDSLAQYKLANSVKEEIEAFLKGLNELIPDNLLSMFDENELELLICGTGSYSITEFKQHHIVSGSSQEFHKVLDWFWTIVSGFTKEEMARLLQFTTGCSQLPPGGFVELDPKFELSAAPTYGNLPTAHTCFNQLCLPDYESMDVMHKALLVSINEGTQGFGLA